MNKTKRHLILSIGAAAFFAIFGYGYMQFVPGISNVFMQFSWIYFACLSFLSLFFILIKKSSSFPSSYGWLTLGVLTLTITSTIQGIFDIASVTYPSLIYLWLVGIVVSLFSVISLLKR